MLFTSCLLAAQAQAALLLQAPGLGGSQETVYWEYYTGTGDNRGLSNGNTAGTPVTGTGTVNPISPGYRAGAGFYSFSGNFGMTATTAVTALADIQNVVFQRVSMANPDATPQENLTWNGTGGPVAAAGGPWLSYYDSSNTLLGRIQATAMGIAASSLGASLGGFDGDFYNFTYQWDLSGVAANVTSVTIDAPILIHSATVEARIDLGGNYVQVIPEPATTSVLSLGLAAFLIRRRR
jgi:hypothetical protein